MKIKKLFALMMALIMTLSFVACGQTEAPAAEAPVAEAPAAEAPAAEAPAAEDALPYEGVTLKWWSAPMPDKRLEYNTNLIKQFEAETGAKVEHTMVPWAEFNTKFLAGFMSGEGPDVLRTTPDNIYDMADAGVLLDLSQYLSQEDMDSRKQIDAGMIDGGLYGVPYSVDLIGRGMAFNMDLLKAAGVNEAPKTRDELVAAAVKIKEAGICEYPLLLVAAGGTEAVLQVWNPWLYTNGGTMLDENGNATLNSPEALETAQFIYDLVYTHKVVPTDVTGIDVETACNLFREGKVAMMSAQVWRFVNPSSFFMVTDAEGNETAYDEFEVYCNIGVADGTNAARMQNNVDMLSVSAVGENTEAAVALMKYLTTREAMGGLIENDGSQMDRSNLYLDSPVPEFPTEWATQYHEDSKEGFFGGPITKGVAGVYDAIFTNYQMLIMGELTPQECVDAMQAAAEAALAG